MLEKKKRKRRQLCSGEGVAGEDGSPAGSEERAAGEEGARRAHRHGGGRARTLHGRAGSPAWEELRAGSPEGEELRAGSPAGEEVRAGFPVREMAGGELHGGARARWILHRGGEKRKGKEKGRGEELRAGSSAGKELHAVPPVREMAGGEVHGRRRTRVEHRAAEEEKGKGRGTKGNICGGNEIFFNFF